MKYLIIGTGGTGGCIGAYLAKAGNDVTFIARGSHLKSIRENGLIVHSTRVGDFTVNNAKACTMEEYSDRPDVIFVCVKYYSIEETNTFINRIAKENTLVIPVLNVFGTGEVMQEACSKCTVLDGCIYIFSMIEEPGVIKQPTSIFKIYFGFRDNQSRVMQNRAENVEKDLRNAGIEAYLSENIKRDALQKFSFVSPIGAAGLYYNTVAGDFMVPGEKQDTFISLVKEVELLGQAMGITFEEDIEEINMKILNGLIKNATTSMQRDVEKGGSSEFDGLVHRVVRLAEKHNVEVPTYKKISDWGKSKNIG